MKKFSLLALVCFSVVTACPDSPRIPEDKQGVCPTKVCANCKKKGVLCDVCSTCKNGLCVGCEQAVLQEGKLYFDEGVQAYFVRLRCASCKAVIALLGTEFSNQRKKMLEERAQQESAEKVFLAQQVTQMVVD